MTTPPPYDPLSGDEPPAPARAALTGRQIRDLCAVVLLVAGAALLVVAAALVSLPCVLAVGGALALTAGTVLGYDNGRG